MNERISVNLWISIYSLKWYCSDTGFPDQEGNVPLLDVEKHEIYALFSQQRNYKNKQSVNELAPISSFAKLTGRLKYMLYRRTRRTV